MPHPPVRTRIEQADRAEDHEKLLKTLLDESNYDFESAKAASAAERERRRREAETSAAEGSTQTPRNPVPTVAESQDALAKLRELYEHAMETGVKTTNKKDNPWTHEQQVFLREYVAAYNGKGKGGRIAWASMKEHFGGFYDYHTEGATSGFVSRQGMSTSGHT